MSLFADLKILYHLTLSPISGRTHSERLESFYSRQAQGYDRFRKRLLHGREDLWRLLPATEGGVCVDMGGGTAANLEFMGERLRSFSKIYVVDLSPSLLKIARERVAAQGWSNVLPLEADATTFAPPEPVDLVTFSY